MVVARTIAAVSVSVRVVVCVVAAVVVVPVMISAWSAVLMMIWCVMSVRVTWWGVTVIVAWPVCVVVTAWCVGVNYRGILNLFTVLSVLFTIVTLITGMTILITMHANRFLTIECKMSCLTTWLTFCFGTVMHVILPRCIAIANTDFFIATGTFPDFLTKQITNVFMI